MILSSITWILIGFFSGAFLLFCMAGWYVGYCFPYESDTEGVRFFQRRYGRAARPLAISSIGILACGVVAQLIRH